MRQFDGVEQSECDTRLRFGRPSRSDLLDRARVTSLLSYRLQEETDAGSGLAPHHTRNTADLSGIVCWYWKINEALTTLKAIDEKLSVQINILTSSPQRNP